MRGVGSRREAREGVLRANSLQSCPSLSTPWTVAHQAPLSVEFSRQECWSGLPCPPPGDLPDPGIEPASPALAGRFFTTEPPGKPLEGEDVCTHIAGAWCCPIETNTTL